MQSKFSQIWRSTLCFLAGLFILQTSQAQAPTPEVLHYKFNEVGTTVTNYASAPPAGTTTATIMGGITQGSTGQCGGALIGSGITSTTDYLNTGWAPNIGTGSWTISFWSSGFGNTALLYYIFGDVGTNSFRCFTNGVAGANNWILRGGGLTDVLITGGATASPTLNTFVYDATLNNVTAYMNGVLVNTVAQTPSAVNLTGTGPFKVMGYSSNVGAPAGGLLDEFRFYSRALSAAEVASLMITATTGTDTRSACNSYTWIDGNTYTTNNNTATHTIVGGNMNGCDSTVTLNLTINTPTTGTDTRTECSPYTWIDGNVYSTNNNTATHTIVGGNANGCDSTVTLNLTINNPTSTSVQTACSSYTWMNGITYTTSNNTATHTLAGAAFNGCDSVITLDLTITTLTPDVLFYKFDGTGTTVPNYATAPPAGTTTATLMGGLTQGGTGQSGHALIGTGVFSSTDYVNTGWAPNLGTGSWTISFWSSNITASATLFYIFGDLNTNSFRCFTNGVAGANNWMLRGAGLTDVLLSGGATTASNLNTFVYDAVANNVKAYLNGVLVNTVAQGTPNVTGTGPLKVMGYNTNVGAPAGGLLDEFRVYGRALTDTEVLALLTPNPIGTAVVNSCNSTYTWLDGNTYSTNNNTALHTILGGAADGCNDTTIMLNLTFNTATSGTDTRTECGSYMWIDGNTYSSSNTTAMHTIVGGNANGCDSVVTLNLTINPLASSTDTHTACGSYMWIDGNTYSTSNTTATHTLVGAAANGCDSVVTLNLTINMPASGTDMQTACDTYMWIDGNTYTANNNTATHTITGGAANGCDSVVTLDLTINTVDTSVTDMGTSFMANATSASYQWVDCNNGNAPIAGETNQTFTPTGNGDYAVEITANGCTAMSACFNVTGVSVQNLNANTIINLYPNPTENQVIVDFGTTIQNATIRIFALDGRILQEHNAVNGKQFNVSLKDYPAAMYFLEVLSKDGQSTMLKVSKL